MAAHQRTSARDRQANGRRPPGCSNELEVAAEEWRQFGARKLAVVWPGARGRTNDDTARSFAQRAKFVAGRAPGRPPAGRRARRPATRFLPSSRARPAVRRAELARANTETRAQGGADANRTVLLLALVWGGADERKRNDSQEQRANQASKDRARERTSDLPARRFCFVLRISRLACRSQLVCARAQLQLATSAPLPSARCLVVVAPGESASPNLKRELGQTTPRKFSERARCRPGRRRLVAGASGNGEPARASCCFRGRAHTHATQRTRCNESSWQVRSQPGACLRAGRVCLASPAHMGLVGARAPTLKSSLAAANVCVHLRLGDAY